MHGEFFEDAGSTRSSPYIRRCRDATARAQRLLVALEFLRYKVDDFTRDSSAGRSRVHGGRLARVRKLHAREACLLMLTKTKPLYLTGAARAQALSAC